MGKLLQPKRTRGKDTDKVVFKILTDIYMKDKAYKIVYDLLKWLWDKSWEMGEKMAELNAKKGLKAIDTKNIQDPFWDLNINKLTSPLLKILQSLTLEKWLVVFAFIETPIKATDISEKYHIAYDTLKKRVKKYFNFINVPKGKTRYKAMLPIPWVLFFLAMVEYIQEKNKEEDNLLVDIINLFNAYKK